MRSTCSVMVSAPTAHDDAEDELGELFAMAFGHP
jgi:hypothetical protein